MVTVTLYVESGAPQEPSSQSRQFIQAVQEITPHQLVEVDVSSDESLKKKYAGITPVVEVGPYRLQWPFNQQDIQVAIGAARDRQAHYQQVEDPAFAKKLERGHNMTRTDRFSLWFSSHYMLFINLVVALYLGLPFLAPVLMKTGHSTGASVIYKIYSVMCHQLPYRSWFLFGEQTAYPRQLAGVTGLQTFEQVTGMNPYDILDDRQFVGNETLGYKVALCERDVAMYAAILAFGLIFSATKGRLRSLPWYLWVIVGILPIGLDGGSQLVGMAVSQALSWFQVRESTPFLRSLTGILFGFTTAWYGLPYVEESMLDTRRLLLHKVAVTQREGQG
jgi:uncharacterized membrane protein